MDNVPTRRDHRPPPANSTGIRKLTDYGNRSRRQMTNAGVVYGVGALVLYGLAFYNLAMASWFNGLVLLLPSTCLAFLAYRYLEQERR